MSALGRKRAYATQKPMSALGHKRTLGLLASIKTLSDRQIADLNAGRGMGLALAAELNGYTRLS